MSKIKIAAQLYTVRNFCKNDADIAVTLKKISEIGYREVQVSGVTPSSWKELKNMCDANGLEIIVTHQGFDDFAYKLDDLIKRHHEMDCKYAGIGSMPRVYPRTAEGFKAFAQISSLWADKLAQEGIKFVYHNHSFEMVRCGDKTGLQIYYENSCGNVQGEIDTFWVAAGGGDPAQYIRMLKGRCDLLHFKDYAVDENDARIMCEIGEGNLNWREILKACGEVNVKWGIVEQDTCRRCPFESLKISYDNLMKMV